MNELDVINNLNLVTIKKKKYETILRVRVTKRNKRLGNYAKINRIELTR